MQVLTTLFTAWWQTDHDTVAVSIIST